MLRSVVEENVGLLRPQKVRLCSHCSGLLLTDADVEVVSKVRRPACPMYRVRVIRLLVKH